jgi:hypothetical protein
MKIKSMSKGRKVHLPIPPAKRYYVLLKSCKQGHLIDAYSGNDEGKIRVVKPKRGRVKVDFDEQHQKPKVKPVKNVESKPVESTEPKSFRSQRASSPTQSAEISLKEYVATEALPVVKEAVTEVKKEVEEKSVRERKGSLNAKNRRINKLRLYYGEAEKKIMRLDKTN